jgi:hypothetical protein
MVKRLKYKDLNQTLYHLRQQVIDSLPFCVYELPKFDNPEQLFKFLKSHVKYKNDPPGMELLQSAQTLLSEDNWHGEYGAGDCDCFTILVLSCCVANGWEDQEIILTGHDKKNARHIYSAVYHNGKRYTMDLTNPYIDIERPYKYQQILKV